MKKFNFLILSLFCTAPAFGLSWGDITDAVDDVHDTVKKVDEAVNQKPQTPQQTPEPAPATPPTQSTTSAPAASTSKPAATSSESKYNVRGLIFEVPANTFKVVDVWDAAIATNKKNYTDGKLPPFYSDGSCKVPNVTEYGSKHSAWYMVQLANTTGDVTITAILYRRNTSGYFNSPPEAKLSDWTYDKEKSEEKNGQVLTYTTPDADYYIYKGNVQSRYGFAFVIEATGGERSEFKPTAKQIINSVVDSGYQGPFNGGGSYPDPQP